MKTSLVLCTILLTLANAHVITKELLIGPCRSTYEECMAPQDWPTLGVKKNCREMCDLIHKYGTCEISHCGPLMSFQCSCF
nr:hypothetical protein BgiMline_013757 [Biomphalaria glabrata]